MIKDYAVEVGDLILNEVDKTFITVLSFESSRVYYYVYYKDRGTLESCGISRFNQWTNAKLANHSPRQFNVIR